MEDQIKIKITVLCSKFYFASVSEREGGSRHKFSSPHFFPAYNFPVQNLSRSKIFSTHFLLSKAFSCHQIIQFLHNNTIFISYCYTFSPKSTVLSKQFLTYFKLIYTYYKVISRSKSLQI